MKSRIYFNKNTTEVIKGIALIMMFIHHFFAFPSWWGGEIYYPVIAKLSSYFCTPLKICVPVFSFLTGYFYFFNEKKTYKYSLKKISDILMQYLCVFFLFSFIAYINGYTYTMKDYILEAFALKHSTMIFCWYVHFYYTVMLILPLYSKIELENIFFDILVAVLILPVGIKILLNYSTNRFFSDVLVSLLTWIVNVFTGFIFAKYDLFDKLDEVNRRLVHINFINVAMWLLITIICPIGRYVAPRIYISLEELPIIHKVVSFGISLDIFYVPLFIYAIVNLSRILNFRFLNICIRQIGKYSLLMWFVSCIFFNNSKSVFQPILYFPRNPLLVTLWGLLLCYIVSIVLNFVLGKINQKKNEVIFRNE